MKKMSTKISYNILNSEFDLDSLALLNITELDTIINNLDDKDLTTYLKFATKLQKLGFDIDKILELINLELGLFGIEPIRLEYYHVDNYYYSTIALYVNNGDTYQDTILFNTEERSFEINSWGDFYEIFSAKNPDPYQEDPDFEE